MSGDRDASTPKHQNDASAYAEFKSGLTWRSFLALLYSVVAFTPALLWLSLTTVGVVGGGLPGMAIGGVNIAYITLFLFAELTALLGKPLTRQEAAVIFGPASAAGEAGFLLLIYKAYFVRSPLLYRFAVDPRYIPTWWAPPHDTLAWDLRTYLHPDMIPPLVIQLVVTGLSIPSGLFWGIIGREIFIEKENLEFPMAAVTVAAIDTFVEKRKERMWLMSWTALIGFIWGIILYAVPTYTSSLATGARIQFLPIPWYDITALPGGTGLQLYLPGGCFGVSTDIILIAMGIMLPSWIVISMFIGSFLRFIVINPLLVINRSAIPTLWGDMWRPGSSLIEVFQRSTLYFWLSPLIGAGLAVGLVPILLRWRIFVGAMRDIFSLKPTGAGKERLTGRPFPLLFLVLCFIIGRAGKFALDMWLVPEFPIWALVIYEFVFPLVFMLGVGRMLGIAGIAQTPPNLSQLVILGSGYKGISGWFLPLDLYPGTYWLSSMKICQLTKTEPMSWIGVNLMAYIPLFIVNLIFMSLLWRMSPIPSDLYPAPAITWPISIMNELVWITRPAEFFNVPWILSSLGIVGALTAVTELMHSPVNIVAVYAGLATPIPNFITMIVGMVVGKVIANKQGKSWFLENKATLAAGLMLGEILAIVCGVSAALIVRSISPLIY